MRSRPLLSLLIGVLAAGAAAELAGQPAWTWSGPADVGVVLALGAGDGVVYAATPAGIYRSTPSGDGWELAGLRSESIQAIAARSGSPIFALFGYGGLAVSRDHGDTWDRLAAGRSGLTAVAIDPIDPATAYLASSDGAVWKTTNSGTNWTRLGATDLSYISAIEFDPHDGALVLVGVYSYAPGLRRSTDGGMTYTTVSIPGRGSDNWVTVGTGVSDLYAATGDSFCRTADGAANWTCSAIPAPIYVYDLVEIPASAGHATPVVLAASDHGLFVSGDRGTTWARAGDPLSSTLYAAAFVPESGEVFVGTDAGIYRSADRGATWDWHGHGLRSSWITALAVDPADPTRMLASGAGFSSDVGAGPGLFRSHDAGQSWSALESAYAPPGFSSLLFDPSDSKTLYGAANGTVYRSEDSGMTWAGLGPSSWVRFLAKDPKSPGTLWAGSTVGLWRSDQRGDSWTSIPVEPSNDRTIYSLVFDSHDPATLYAGTNYSYAYGYYYYYSDPVGGSIFVSRDMGATWTRGEEDLGAAPVALAADPFAAGVVYAGTAGAGVLRSSDSGRTWMKPPSASPRSVADLVADPTRPGHLYAAADGSIYRSRDGGASWEPFADGLDGTYLFDLAIAGNGRRLVGVSSGSGIYQIDLGATAPSFPCVPDAGRLCAVGGRYALDVAVQRRGTWSAGAAHALTDRAGYFAFPAVTGDASFPEVVVKMLPEGALGPGGPAIFHASLTSLPYVVTLTDTTTGRQHLYTGGSAGGGGGTSCGGASRPFPEATAPVFRSESSAAPAEAALSLLDHRFSVTLHAHHPSSGRESNGLAVAGDDRWGYFSMPDVTGESSLPEVVVKMVDFRAITGKFWFFYTGLTGFDYTLTVTDSKTGAVRTYESPGNFCGGAAADAFAE